MLKMLTFQLTFHVSLDFFPHPLLKIKNSFNLIICYNTGTVRDKISEVKIDINTPLSVIPLMRDGQMFLHSRQVIFTHCLMTIGCVNYHEVRGIYCD